MEKIRESRYRRKQTIKKQIFFQKNLPETLILWYSIDVCNYSVPS